MNNLNPNQEQAVKNIDGPLLALAGAGTGKTKIITERIIYILDSYAARADEILAVTFTNKAAAEMKYRISEKIGDEANNLWLGTFHRIASRILKRYPEYYDLDENFTIIDSADSNRIIKKFLDNLKIDQKEFPAKNYLWQIALCKDRNILPENCGNQHFNLPNFARIYTSYQAELKNLNFADFGDLLLSNLIIFKKKPDILEYYQNKFKYILVDEYQDSNNIQYIWLQNLAAKYKNICAVGDDDQSIYSWRGAEISNILNFNKDYPDAKIIRLEQNYRSKNNILKAASKVISFNSKRHEKTLFSDQGEGQKIAIASFYNDREEAGGVAQQIKKLVKKGDSYKNMAILVRAGYQTRSFEEIFMQLSLPYQIIGGLKFFERREIKDLISYLQLIANHNNNLALERIINLPKRGIGKATIDKLSQKAFDTNSSIFDTIFKYDIDGVFSAKISEKLLDFGKKITFWKEFYEQNQDLSALLNKICDESGYLQMWQNDNSYEAKGRVENIKEFCKSIGEFENLQQFLDHISLISDSDNMDNNSDKINIMTIHAAKGLEFKNIFIPGLEDGIFPSSKSMEEGGLEEERRLFYVAITRAKERVFMSYAKSRFVFGSYQNSIISRFLSELPEEICQFNDDIFEKNDFLKQNPENFSKNSAISKKKENFLEQNLKGKKVFHQKFGYGFIISQDDKKFEINFQKTGTKLIMKQFIEIC
jgi:DNA helicase-2/ATP-dependent DNA helicase PcrA